MATSREAFGVAGERVLRVRSLAAPDPSATGAALLQSAAVRLFADRAADAGADTASNEAQWAAVAEICRRVDGIPLAIELAAARSVSMRPAEIAAHLDERFRLLTGTRRGRVERQQTLRATVEWSYQLLEPDDRAVFDRLGVFAGSFERGRRERRRPRRRSRRLADRRFGREPGGEVDAGRGGRPRRHDALRHARDVAAVRAGATRGIRRRRPMASSSRGALRRIRASGGRRSPRPRRGALVGALRRRARQPARRRRLGPRSRRSRRARARGAARRRVLLLHDEPSDDERPGRPGRIRRGALPARDQDAGARRGVVLRDARGRRRTRRGPSPKRQAATGSSKER